jgi:hypothetical protein
VGEILQTFRNTNNYDSSRKYWGGRDTVEYQKTKERSGKIKRTGF